jgi:hypothetical protein
MALGFGGRGIETLTLGASVTVDPRTGAAGLRVPVPVPAGRGLAPSLALVYGSGGGNSAFGAGWALAGLPAVTVAATRRLPRWDGRDGLEHNPSSWRSHGIRNSARRTPSVLVGDRIREAQRTHRVCDGGAD